MGTPCVNNYRALFKDYSVGVVKGNVIPSSAFINITQIGQAHRSVTHIVLHRPVRVGEYITSANYISIFILKAAIDVSLSKRFTYICDKI